MMTSGVLGDRASKDSAAVEPANSACEDFAPVQVTGLQHAAASLLRYRIRSVRERRDPDRCKRRHVWSTNTVMLKHLVERLHAHRANSFVDEVADRIVNHRGCDTGLQLKAVRQIRRTVEFTTADVNVEVRGFAKWNNAWVESVNQSTKRHKIEGTRLWNVEH